ncbi:metallophosphoesterase [Candidatus Sumerlaeota bacterium]|nr:metallophosphoesterase [Candidatus Sumerlaeota bacterium]
MNIFKIIVAVLFWMGQVKLCVTIVNKYIVFMRDSLFKHVFTIFFGLFMTFWFPLFLILCHGTVLAQNLLLLHPVGVFEFIMLAFLVYGLALLIRANVTAIYKAIQNPLPPQARLIMHEKKASSEGVFWRKPRFPLFLENLLNAINDYYNLEVNVYEIKSPGLPPSFDGFRLAHITDLHLNHYLDPRFYDFCIQEINNLKPDLTVVTGDIISRKKFGPNAAFILSRIDSPFGVFALRGNHDFWEDGKKLRREIMKKGIRVLDNKSIEIRKGRDRIRLAGIEHPWKKLKTWDQDIFPQDGMYSVCITHTPDNFLRAERAGAALTLCGHTHGGQIRLPFFGPVVCPSRYSRRFDQGFFQQGGALLYVNRGVGSTVPFRFRCSPEIALFILKC